MSHLSKIKSKILTLEGGLFQRLCDDWLQRKGNEHINPIGMMRTKDKVTKGTPDTLIPQSDGTYIFSEYTTQIEKLFDKLKDDIEKCLNKEKTGISPEHITRIILCYSGKLTTHEIECLREICSSRDVQLDQYSLDSLALSIQNDYPILAERYLGIELDTGQLLSIDDFIECYESSPLTTSISNKILFQKDTLESKKELLKASNFLLISGAAGTGKTLFSVNLARMMLEEQPALKVYCLFYKGVDLHRDITAYFSEPGDYLIFIDDANRLDNRLDYILHYLNELDERRRFRIIATVRDYARNTVIEKVNQFTELHEHEVRPLTDEQIKDLIVELFEIKNAKYQERIQEVAKGNTRLAMMVSQLAIDSQSLNSIKNVTLLYNKYFDQNKNIKQIIDNKNLLITAAVICFFRKVDKFNDTQMGYIQKYFCIQPEEFWEYVNILHQNEIVDLYEDEVVKISDQILSTYLFYISVFDKKVIPFSIIVNNFFPALKKTILDSLNPVISTFDQEKIIEEIKVEIQSIYTEFSKSKAESEILDFLSTFWFVLPSQALLFSKKLIDDLPKLEINWKEKNFEKFDNSSSPEIIPVLNLLRNFRYWSESEVNISIDLILDHLEKTERALEPAKSLFTNTYNINPRDLDLGYYIQTKIIDSLIERMSKGKNYLFTKLFIFVSNIILKVECESSYMKSNDVFTIVRFNLKPDQYLLPLREKIISHLSLLVRQSHYKNSVCQVFENYISKIPFSGKEMTKADLPFIEKYLIGTLEKSELSDCLMIQKLCKQLKRLEIDFPENWESEFSNEIIELLDVLLEYRNERRMLEMPHEEYQEYRQQCLIKYFSNYTKEQFKSFINHCILLHDCLSGRERDYSLKTGIRMSLDSIAEYHPEMYPDVISCYLEYDDLFELQPYSIIEHLFKVCSEPKAVWELINSKDYRWRKYWCSFYFLLFPENKISSETVDCLLSHLNNVSSSELPWQLSFLQKFKTIEKDIFSIVVRLLVDKSKNDKNYARPLGDLYQNNSDYFGEWFEIFEADQDLVFDAYLAALKVEGTYLDYSGEALNILTSHKKGFLKEVINCVIKINDGNLFLDISLPKFYFLWDRESFLEDIETCAILMFEQEKRLYRLRDNKLLMELFSKEKNQQENEELTLKKHQFFKYTVERNISDIQYLCYIFDIVCNMGEDFKIELLSFFLERNKNFEDFKTLDYELTVRSWSGSKVPILEREKQLLIKMLPLLSSTDFLEHKAYVEEQIILKNKYIESEKKRDYLEEW